MCRHSDTLPVRVWIDASLSHSEKGYWKIAQIDRCIAPAVEAIQKSGINMLASCCGHGKAMPKIDIQKQHLDNCCFWLQDEPGDPDWCDCGFVQNENVPFWAQEETTDEDSNQERG